MKDKIFGNNYDCIQFVYVKKLEGKADVLHSISKKNGNGSPEKTT